MTDADTTRTPTTPPSGAAPTGAPPAGGTPTAETAGTGSPPPETAGGASGTPPTGATPTAGATPPPTPPSSSWRPPASDSGRNASMVFGAIVLIVGLWFFATSTLGLDLPDIDWGQLWPVILIVLGAWIVLNAMRQRAR